MPRISIVGTHSPASTQGSVPAPAPMSTDTLVAEMRFAANTASTGAERLVTIRPLFEAYQTLSAAIDCYEQAGWLVERREIFVCAPGSQVRHLRDACELADDDFPKAGASTNYFILKPRIVVRPGDPIEPLLQIVQDFYTMITSPLAGAAAARKSTGPHRDRVVVIRVDFSEVEFVESADGEVDLTDLVQDEDR